MPHWSAVLHTSSPAALEGCNGDPELVRERVYAEAPHGASVRSLHWKSGEDHAVVSVEGPAAREYLESLGATDVVEILSAQERKAQMG